MDSIRISREETIELNEALGKVFPLFGPVEEKKWAYGWAPEIVYPDDSLIEEGMVFLTESTFQEEDKFIWVVGKYNPEKYHIEYIVTTANRAWNISVRCAEAGNKTLATVKYTYTALNSLGERLNKKALDSIFIHSLKDWQDAINHYLATGECLEI